MNSLRRILILVILTGIHTSVMGQPIATSGQSSMPEWLAKGVPHTTVGIGIAPYSSFNPAKAWREAFYNGIEDLNANHSMVVYSYGHQIGRGPLRLRSNFAIRTLIDSAKTTVIDSIRWKDRAFLLIKPTNIVPDSIIYPENSRELQRSHFPSDDSALLQSRGSSPRIESNWNLSFARAKQNALKQLAERLSVEVSTETYAKGGVSRRYYSFSSMFAFQRIRVLQRTIGKDSISVQVAVKPNNVKILMN